MKIYNCSFKPPPPPDASISKLSKLEFSRLKFVLNTSLSLKKAAELFRFIIQFGLLPFWKGKTFWFIFLRSPPPLPAVLSDFILTWHFQMKHDMGRVHMVVHLPRMNFPKSSHNGQLATVGLCPLRKQRSNLECFPTNNNKLE